MKRKLTQHQLNCVERIIDHMREYLDLRYSMTAQANPRYEDAWPNLQFLLIQQLRNTLENDKMWGPQRFVIGEVLCSNDKNKVRDIFNPTNQVSVQNEIVDRADDSKHKTADILDIHDFKTLYSAIDPNIANIASVMQIYMWWDLADASDLARFHFTSSHYRELQREVSQQNLQHYAKVLKKEEDELPTANEVRQYVAGQLKDTLNAFQARRTAEPGYKLIIAHHGESQADGTDLLIQTLAREIVLLKNIEDGQELDDNLKQQFARALRISVDQVTTDKEKDYLKNAIREGKSRLRRSLSSLSGGEPFNFKESQAEELERRYNELVGNNGEESTVQEETPAAESAG